MMGSTQKWWSVAALALVCLAPCAFATSSLTMTGAGNNVMDNVLRRSLLRDREWRGEYSRHLR